MTTIDEQIEVIKKEIRETPYHKATEHYIGKLRAKIARLKDKQVEAESKKSGGGVGYNVKKQGDATVVLVGPPSVGKSTLINKLTNAKSKIAPYAFTTVSVIPGMMEYKNARIQILDVPGLIKGAEEGKGRGKEVLSVIRGCSLVILITDTDNLDAFERLYQVLERNGIRPDKKKPDVTLDKKLQGGVNVKTNIRQPLNKETIKEVVMEMGIKNAEVILNEKVNMNTLIDTLSRNRVYVPTLKVINKIDQSNLDNSIYQSGDFIKISAEKEINLEKLKEAIWKKLNFVTVFLVSQDADPSFDHPVIMKIGNTLKDIAESIGTDFSEKKKRAIIWGNGSKFPGQEVSLQTEIQEGMQVRFI